jgi:hypothetical protein
MLSHWYSGGVIAIGLVIGACSESATSPFDEGPPLVEFVDASSNPMIPANLNLKVTCLIGPDTLESSPTCPVIQWGGYTYWAYSDGSNATSMTIIAYDAAGNALEEWERLGARYVWQITVDEVARTVTVWGQASNTIAFMWDELRF